jgi:hypothetical protein
MGHFAEDGRKFQGDADEVVKAIKAKLGARDNASTGATPLIQRKPAGASPYRVITFSTRRRSLQPGQPLRA